MFEVKTEGEKKTVSIDFPTIKTVISRFITINGIKRSVIGIGKATCGKGDIFNKDFGKELTETRAWINLLKTEEYFLVDLTKQPEWRKEKKQESNLINIDVNNLTPLYRQKLVQSLYNQVKELEQENKSLKDK